MTLYQTRSRLTEQYALGNITVLTYAIKMRELLRRDRNRLDKAFEELIRLKHNIEDKV